VVAQERQTTTPPVPISTAVSSRKNPAALLEYPVDAGVELARRLIDRQLTVGGTLGDQAHLGGDAFPLGHLGRRLGALQLLAKGAGVDVALECCLAPRGASRWKITRALMEAALDLRLRKVLDETPRAELLSGPA